MIWWHVQGYTTLPPIGYDFIDSAAQASHLCCHLGSVRSQCWLIYVTLPSHYGCGGKGSPTYEAQLMPISVVHVGCQTYDLIETYM